MKRIIPYYLCIGVLFGIDAARKVYRKEMKETKDKDLMEVRAIMIALATFILVIFLWPIRFVAYLIVIGNRPKKEEPTKEESKKEEENPYVSEKYRKAYQEELDRLYKEDFNKDDSVDRK